MFDYLFYRFYCHYAKSKYYDKSSSVLSGSIALTALEFCMMAFVILSLELYYDSDFFQKHNTICTISLGITIIAFFCFNLRKYRGKADVIIEKYKNHPANNWLKFWMIVALYFVLIFLPFVLF